MIRLFGHKRGRTAGFGARPGSDAARQDTGKDWASSIALAISFVVLVLSLTRFPRAEAPVMTTMGDAVASGQEILAGFEFETVDLMATNQARDAAAATTPDYYRVDHARVQDRLRALRENLEPVQQERAKIEALVLSALRNSTNETAEAELVATAVARHVSLLKEEADWADMPDAATLTLWLTPDMESIPKRVLAEVAEEETAGGAEALPRPVVALSPEEPLALVFSYGDELNKLSLAALEYVLSEGVRKADISEGNKGKPIVLMGAPALEGSPSNRELILSEIPDPEMAELSLVARLRDMAAAAAQGTEEPTEWAKLHEAALAMVRPLLSDTIRFDRVYSDAERERARAAVEPQMKLILRDEKIQHRGERWTAQSRSDLETYLRMIAEKPRQRVAASLLAHAILVAFILECLRRSVALFRRNRDGSFSKQLSLALLLMCSTLVIGRVVWYLEPSGLLLPIASAGILCAILVSVPVAAILSMLTALLVSAQYAYDWRLLVVGGSMSLAGVFGIYKVRRRSDMAAAALTVTGVGLVVMAALSLAWESMESQAPFWQLVVNETSYERLILIALNGGICLMLVPAVLPPLERLFGITTDIQLLEYSDLNNDLLSQLARDAGATYSHSQILGQLASAAADAIGANGLLAKVCAYYHDIGKMRRSEYFSENQTGYNIHDELSPRLSARAIASHVIQGAQMAREYRLPKPIIDGILEHHGTSLIGYFYQQAKEQQKHGDVSEEDFRYPGPKPQSPETAILMICDATESGVRSIKNPNEERVREFVDKIIAGRAADRQFDECDLTMKQLNTIAEVLTKQVMTNLHTRVAYPEVRSEDKVDNVVAMRGNP